MDEQEAVRRCRDGDRTAFRSLAERYQGVLYGTAYLMTRSEAEAEDMVQDALLAAWQGLDGFREGRPLKPWLVRILVNRVLAARRRRRLPTVPLPDWREPGALDPAMEGAEARDAVRRAMASLDEQQRQVLVLRYYADLSVPEIARALRRREGTVKSQMHRALAAMRRRMTEP